jgi:hypothetical protein
LIGARQSLGTFLNDYSNKNVPNDCSNNHGNANVLARTAKTRQSGNLLTTKEMPMFWQ